MSLFNPQLLCVKHNQIMDVYCQNPQCKIETRICCFKCAKENHPHQTTRIYELEELFNNAIEILQDKCEIFNDLIQHVIKKAEAISQLINKKISFLKLVTENSEHQTLTNFIIAQKMSSPENLNIFKQKVNQLIEKQPHLDISLQSKTNNYVKLIEENKKDEAKQALQEIINLDWNNQIYKLEMNRLNGDNRQNEPDVSHLILQYETYLMEDQNKREALKVLDQILEIDSNNFIYQRERKRLNHEIVEYLYADDKFQTRQYLTSLIEYEKLLKIRSDPRIFYQKGLTLFYIQSYEESLKAIQEALKIDSQNIQYHITKTQLLFAKQDFENLKIQAFHMQKLFGSINKVIEGQILMLQEKYDEAQKCFKQAIEIDYFQFEAHFLQAQCLSNSILKEKNQLLQPQQLLQNDEQLQNFVNENKFTQFYYMYIKSYFEKTPEFQAEVQKIKHLLKQSKENEEQSINNIAQQQ